jgi:hypothetical protein
MLTEGDNRSRIEFARQGEEKVAGFDNYELEKFNS